MTCAFCAFGVEVSGGGGGDGGGGGCGGGCGGDWWDVLVFNVYNASVKKL